MTTAAKDEDASRQQQPQQVAQDVHRGGTGDSGALTQPSTVNLSSTRSSSRNSLRSSKRSRSKYRLRCCMESCRSHTGNMNRSSKTPAAGAPRRRTPWGLGRPLAEVSAVNRPRNNAGCGVETWSGSSSSCSCGNSAAQWSTGSCIAKIISQSCCCCCRSSSPGAARRHRTQDIVSCMLCSCCSNCSTWSLSLCRGCNSRLPQSKKRGSTECSNSSTRRRRSSRLIHNTCGNRRFVCCHSCSCMRRCRCSRIPIKCVWDCSRRTSAASDFGVSSSSRPVVQPCMPTFFCDALREIYSPAFSADVSHLSFFQVSFLSSLSPPCASPPSKSFFFSSSSLFSSSSSSRSSCLISAAFLCCGSVFSVSPLVSLLCRSGRLFTGPWTTLLSTKPSVWPHTKRFCFAFSFWWLSVSGSAAAAVAPLCMTIVIFCLRPACCCGLAPLLLCCRPSTEKVSITRVRSSLRPWCCCGRTLVSLLLLQVALPFSLEGTIRSRRKTSAVETPHVAVDLSGSAATTDAALAGAAAGAASHSLNLCPACHTTLPADKAAVSIPKASFSSTLLRLAPLAASAALYYTIALHPSSSEAFPTVFDRRSSVSAAAGAAVTRRDRGAAPAATGAVPAAVKACLVLLALAATFASPGLAVGVAASLPASAAAVSSCFTCGVVSSHVVAAAVSTQPLSPVQSSFGSPHGSLNYRVSRAFFSAVKSPLFLHSAAANFLPVSFSSCLPTKIFSFLLFSASVSSACLGSPSQRRPPYVSNVPSLLPPVHSFLLSYFHSSAFMRFPSFRASAVILSPFQASLPPRPAFLSTVSSIPSSFFSAPPHLPYENKTVSPLCSSPSPLSLCGFVFFETAALSLSLPSLWSLYSSSNAITAPAASSSISSTAATKSPGPDIPAAAKTASPASDALPSAAGDPLTVAAAQSFGAGESLAAAQPGAAAAAAGVSVSLGAPKLRKKALRVGRFKTPRIPYEPQDSIFHQSLLPSYEAVISAVQQSTPAAGDAASIAWSQAKRNRSGSSRVPPSAGVTAEASSDDIKENRSSAAAAGGPSPAAAAATAVTATTTPTVLAENGAIRGRTEETAASPFRCSSVSLSGNSREIIRALSFPSAAASSQRLLRVPGMNQKLRRALWIDRHLTRRMKGAPSPIREAVVDVFLSHNAEEDIVLSLGPPTTATQRKEEERPGTRTAASPEEKSDVSGGVKMKRPAAGAAASPQEGTAAAKIYSKAQQATLGGTALDKRPAQRDIVRGAIATQQAAAATDKKDRQVYVEGSRLDSPKEGSQTAAAVSSPLIGRLKALSLPGLLYLTGGEVKLLLARHVELLLPMRLENCRAAVTWLLQEKKWSPAAAKQLLLHVPRALSLNLPQVKDWFAQYETLFIADDPHLPHKQQKLQQGKDGQQLLEEPLCGQQRDEQHEPEQQEQCQQLDYEKKRPSEGTEQEVQQPSERLSRLVEQVALRVPMAFRVRRPLSKVKHFAKVWRSVRATRCEYRPAACWPSFSVSQSSGNRDPPAYIDCSIHTDRSNVKSGSKDISSKSSTRRSKYSCFIGAAGGKGAALHAAQEKRPEMDKQQQQADNPHGTCGSTGGGGSIDGKKQQTRYASATERKEEIENFDSGVSGLQQQVLGQPDSPRDSGVAKQSIETEDQKTRTKEKRSLSTADEDRLYRGYYELLESYVGNLNASEQQIRRLEVEAACIARARKREELALQQLFTRYPKILTMKLERNVRAKLLYLQNCMMKELDEVLLFPQYLSYSLRGRIIPRHIALVNAYLAEKKKQRMAVNPLYNEGEDLAAVIRAARTRSHWDNRMQQKQKLLLLQMQTSHQLHQQQQRRPEQPRNPSTISDLQQMHEPEEEEEAQEKEEGDEGGQDERKPNIVATDEVKKSEKERKSKLEGRANLEIVHTADDAKLDTRKVETEGRECEGSIENVEDEETDMGEEEWEVATASTRSEEAQYSMYDAAYWERRTLLEEELVPVIDERKGWRGIRPYQPFSMPPLPPLREMYATSDERFMQLNHISYQDFVSAKVDAQAVRNPQSLF